MFLSTPHVDTTIGINSFTMNSCTQGVSHIHLGAALKQVWGGAEVPG